ncbi:Uncharacterised protein [Vibrio cholerae]|nr:Uncharacterised protein [Vibrio cholerae]
MTIHFKLHPKLINEIKLLIDLSPTLTECLSV